MSQDQTSAVEKRYPSIFQDPESGVYWCGSGQWVRVTCWNQEKSGHVNCQSSEVDQFSVYYSLEGQEGKLKLKFPLHIEVAVRAVWTLELSPTRLYY